MKNWDNPTFSFFHTSPFHHGKVIYLYTLQGNPDILTSQELASARRSNQTSCSSKINAKPTPIITTQAGRQTDTSILKSFKCQSHVVFLSITNQPRSQQQKRIVQYRICRVEGLYSTMQKGRKCIGIEEKKAGRLGRKNCWIGNLNSDERLSSKVTYSATYRLLQKYPANCYLILTLQIFLEDVRIGFIWFYSE